MKVKFYVAIIASIVILFLSCKLNAQNDIAPGALLQMKMLMAEKESRNPAQRKMDSHLNFEIKKEIGGILPPEIARIESGVKKDNQGKVLVDIRATVTPELIRAITGNGGEIIFQSAKFSNVRATIPLMQLEIIAGRDEVQSIYEADIAETHGRPSLHEKLVGNTPYLPDESIRKRYTGFRPGFEERANRVSRQLRYAIDNGYMPAPIGSKNSEGDVTHRAAEARIHFAVDGTGIKIGVLSDCATAAAIAQSQASGDLGPVTVLPGQAGTGSNEGTAMLEIIHDIAPGAQLYFATAFTSQASFAQNILDLRAAGCDIIVDDIFYFREAAFQDDNVAQSVNTVTANGAMYFSSAGNEGNKDDNTSGVWEGDYVDGGAVPGSLGVGNYHNFGSATSNLITLGGRLVMQWSDPLHFSGNDYDLYVFNNTLTAITGFSTTVQDGNDDAYEDCNTRTTGERVVVVKRPTAAVRALHVNCRRGVLATSTFGQTSGHSAALNAFSVAATPANGAFGSTPNPTGPYPGVYTTTNLTEIFSSDGPRRKFYNPDGSPITPGNVLFGTNGGVVLQKPDITAADGVQVTGNGGFTNPFYGTSAAAPHAAAIASLMKQAKPGVTNAQIRAALTSTALDIETPGVDRNTGAGIIMAYQAIEALNPTPVANIIQGTVTGTEGSFGNGDGTIEPGELGNLLIQLTNAGTGTATSVTAVLTTATPGVTITQNTASYGTLAAGASATNTATPYKFGVSSSLACGATINFTLTVTYTGGPSPKVFSIPFVLGIGIPTISNTLGTTATSGPGYTATSGQQTGRIVRAAPASSCAVPKLAPGLTVTTGARQYDAYVFSNSTANAQCVTVTMNAANGVNLYCVAYNNAGFVPANPNANYVADGGPSSTSQEFTFTAPPGQSFTVVVHDINVTPASNSPYTLNVSVRNCPLPPPVCTPIIINPVTIPAGVSGTPYSQVFTATGGSGSYVFNLSGTLPTGMSFSGNILSGTPTQTGSFPLTLVAADAAGCTAGLANFTLIISVSSSNPTVIIDQAVGQADPTSTSPINFTVVFSEAVTGFTASDVTLSGTALPTTAVITGSGPTYNVAVSGMTTAGTVTANIPAAVVTNLGGLPNTASTSTDNTVTFNATRPTVIIDQAITQADPTTTSPINFTVVFSQSVTGFTNSDITLSGTANPTTAVVTGSGTTYNVAVSGMTGSGTVIADIPANIAFNVGVLGNFASTSTDNTVTYNAPACTITCPANITVSNDVNQCGAVVNYPAIGTTGSCGTITASPASGSFFPKGTTTVLVSSTAGPTCSFTVTVNDTQAPTITCPANITVSNDANQCGAVVTYPAISASDNCPGTTIVASPASGSFFPKGTTTVTVTATDVAGNTKTCTFTVTVNDTQAPTITCPANITVSNTAGLCGANVTFAAPTVSDNCPGTTIVSNPASGSFFPKGTTTVTSIATDASGNTKTCTFTVTVNDTQVPTITCPANITVTAPAGVCNVAVTYTVTAADNCPGVTTSLVSGLASGSLFPVGVTTVTHKATDAAGNVSATCSFTVTVVGQPPVIGTQPVTTSVCVGNSVTFSIAATNFVSYQWQQFNGTTWVDIAGATNPTYTVTNVNTSMNTNTFRVVVNGFCGTSVISNNATLFAKPLPIIQLSASIPPSLIPGQVLTITATTNAPGGTIVWYKNGIVIPGQTSMTLSGLTVDDIGTYKAVYTDASGCTSTTADLAVTGLPYNRLWVYPNPNNGVFQVRYYNSINEPVTVNVFDSKGAKVYQRAITTSTPYSRIDVDLSMQAAGVYVVEVRDASGKRAGATSVLIRR